ncbi:MAG: dioxygenase [Gammaproteobacteria bacterium]|nr:dioxygenase [Gammaproteobacteria bacterium]MCP5195686.1 dioxygenase [Gammaproteobacteria bacterium]
MNHGAKAVFISHGGGPMPLLGDVGHSEMLACLEGLAANLRRPDAVVVVSAHWEEQVATITAGETPALIYDYYGFPQESYEIAYPCRGEPALARELYQLLTESGIKAKLDKERGFDHGVFVPLKIMYPEASIPCVQLSLLASLDPSSHIDIGKALRSLSRENVLLVGSGFSFHNLKAFFAPETIETRDLNHAFEQWLHDTCGNSEYSEEERTRRLNRWFEAPGARFCHPREEHLLPLHVCYGAALKPCSESLKLSIMHKESSMYVW